jgi:16S rRNA (cytosine967-C5)-methyltransferase
VLHEVGANEAYANVALAAILHDQHFDARDSGFVTEIVNGTLRNSSLLDAIIARCSSRPLTKIDPRLLDVLRMSCYQLLFMNVGAHAAVSTGVDLAVSVAGEGGKGYVNAILRAVSRRSREQWLAEVVPDRDNDFVGSLSLRYSHPKWIVSALRDSLGREGADQIEALLATNNRPPPVTLVARPGRSDVAELLSAGGTRGRWSEFAVLAPTGTPGRLPGVRRGDVGVQDEGSQLVAIALAHAELSGADATWVDLCAGPGGKVALLAALAAQRGALVVGVELHEHRARLIKQMTATAAGMAGVVVADARKPPIRYGVDRVLVDAPCTGLGVLRRRPEVRWRRVPGDIPVLSALQRDLLNAAIDIVRPGGVIGYATCSPHLAETDLIVKAVTRSRDDVVVEDARPLFESVPDLGDGPFVRLWPQIHDTDGMFFALLRRR